MNKLDLAAAQGFRGGRTAQILVEPGYQIAVYILNGPVGRHYGSCASHHPGLREPQ